MRNALLGVLLIAAAAANADMALAYRGKLVAAGGGAKVSTKVPMAVEFRLYRNAQPGETAPLWGRAMSVRFDDAGLFYVELSDASGVAVPNAEHGRLSDAIAAAGGADAWLSVKPVGYGELLPRKRIGGVHRAEHASTARRAGRLEAGGLRAETISAGSCEIGGSLTVTDSFAVAGKIENAIDGTADISIGSPSLRPGRCSSPVPSTNGTCSPPSISRDRRVSPSMSSRDSRRATTAFFPSPCSPARRLRFRAGPRRSASSSS